MDSEVLLCCRVLAALQRASPITAAQRAGVGGGPKQVLWVSGAHLMLCYYLSCCVTLI